MVILGGLEIIAAGYVLNELHKENKTAERRDHSERRHGDKHHRRDSSHRRRRDSPNRPSRQPQSLQPPQQALARPVSAPPPAIRPAWEQQWPPAPPQQWQPRPHPQHAATMPPQRPNIYPPPGIHIDLKTGKLQNNLYPPDMQPQARNVSQPTNQYGLSNHGEQRRGEPDFYAAHPSERSDSMPVYGEQQHRYSQPQVNSFPVSSPHAGYVELDSETPGRYVPSDRKEYYQSSRPRRDDSWSPPPPYRH